MKEKKQKRGKPEQAGKAQKATKPAPKVKGLTLEELSQVVGGQGGKGPPNTET